MIDLVKLETGEEKIIRLIGTDSPELVEFITKLQLIYVEAYGLQWLKKEVDIAWANMIDNKKGRRLSIVDNLKEWFASCKEMATIEPNLFIGTNQVSPDQYLIYCKGIYVLAAYKLLKGTWKGKL